MSTTQQSGQEVMIIETNTKLAEARSTGAHVLAPVTIQTLPAMHRPVVVSVMISADPKDKEVYQQKGGGYSLSAIGWKKLADGMGIQMDDRRTGRVDDGKDPNRVEYRCVGYIKAQDGTWRKLMGDKEIRMENVIEELLDTKRQKAQDYLASPKDAADFKRAWPNPEDWVREQVRQEALQIKKHLLSRAQTGAMSRMIKSIGIRETYTPAELQKPFVFPKLVMELDPNNDGDRHFLRMQAAGAINELYAPPIESMQTRVLPPEPTGPIEFYDIPSTPTDVTPHPKEQPKEQPKAQPAGFTPPSPEEVLRHDFKEQDPLGQKRMLDVLMKRKGYTGKVTGEIEAWTPQQRAGFFEKLVKMTDVAPAASPVEEPLPFDN